MRSCFDDAAEYFCSKLRPWPRSQLDLLSVHADIGAESPRIVERWVHFDHSLIQTHPVQVRTTAKATRSKKVERKKPPKGPERASERTSDRRLLGIRSIGAVVFLLLVLFPIQEFERKTCCITWSTRYKHFCLQESVWASKRASECAKYFIFLKMVPY